MRRRLPARWPVLPITEYSLGHVIHELAREQWRSAPGGPMPEFKVKARGLLQSALVQPFQLVGGRPIYPAVIPKAACLFRGLVKNHGLEDGNKRMGVTATGVFLIVNGYELQFRPAELRDYALKVARHEGNYPVARIERWIRPRVRLQAPARLAMMRTEILEEVYARGDPVALLFENGGDDASEHS